MFILHILVLSWIEPNQGQNTSPWAWHCWTPDLVLFTNKDKHSLFTHSIYDWMQHVSANLSVSVSWFHKTDTDTPPPQDAHFLNAPQCDSIERGQSKSKGFITNFFFKKGIKSGIYLYSFYFDWFPWCQSFDTVDTASPR